MNDIIVIVSIARTPLCNLLGAFKNHTAHTLGACVIKALIERTALSPADIQEVLLGCVLSAGQGQAPARQAALQAGLPVSVPCTTLNKVCGSGMKAVMLAHDIIRAGSATTMVAGGMESMTKAPYLINKGRQGYRLGHDVLYDHLVIDGLEDPNEHQPMGYFADNIAKKLGYTRKQQDDYAISSFERAQFATREGAFEAEIIPVSTLEKNEEMTIDQDEHPFSVPFEKIPTLPPLYHKEGTVTAGNGSAIADGAAGLLLMSETEAKKRGLIPLARIVGHSSSATTPAEFPLAPIAAINHLLKKLHWTVNDVDLFEINEAFAVVTLATIDALGIPREKVNIYGGACALGHPIGATGARLIVTLISALKQNQLKRGIASLCIGGGEATAIAIEVSDD
ncbi:MAG TPA: thiolase family protein [Gammaproteobacteria bacterium]|jgi:acetyl-CoA C-acetyltransferase|nr:thiolase family protein [Gammaproteobacteria bacterium]